MKAKKASKVVLSKKKPAKHVVKLRVAPTVVDTATLPEPVRDLVEAIHAAEVAEIVFVDPEPARLAKLKAWLESTHAILCPKCSSESTTVMGSGHHCNQCGHSF